MSLLGTILQPLYNRTIRNYLPRKLGLYNGYVARRPRLFDETDVFPDHEAALIEGIQNRTENGDSVVIVGGGFGVSSVVAATRAGDDGSVECYEGSAEHVDLIQETFLLNGCEGEASINHAIVGKSPHLYSDAGNAATIDAKDLPECDILVLDCEGSELEILRELEHSPRDIVVETHGFLGAPEEKVREILSDKGYDVIDRGTEDESNGVFVLTATT